MAEALFQSGAWERTILGDGGRKRLAVFWEHVRTLPWNDLQEGDSVDYLYPLTLHGDGAPSYNGESTVILSWASPLCGGGSLGSRMLICAINKSKMLKNTLQAILEHVAESFNKMIRVDGCATGPWRAKWFGLKGDCEFLVWCCEWSRNHLCNLCCPYCMARRDREPLYTATRPGAPWEATVLSEASLQASGEPMTRTSLCKIIGWQHRRAMFDVMHIIHLGILKVFLGGVIILLAEHPHFYGQRQMNSRLGAAFNSFKAWCRRHRVSTSVKKFTEQRLKRTSKVSWPMLPVKASNAKRVLWWLQEETRIAALSPEPMLRLSAVAVYEMCMFLFELDRADIILSQGEADIATQHGQNFVDTFNALCVESARVSAFLFHPIPKVHYFVHQLRELPVERLNLRHLANFQDEDFMGRIARVAKRSHRSTMSSSVLLRLPA